jgi:signal transduction histidine kinase
MARSVLLIDSVEERRRSTAASLVVHDMSVLSAANLATAQAIVRHNRPAAVLFDAELIGIPDLREKLFIHGLNVDTPFIVLAEDKSPLAHSNLPYGVLARPLSAAGVHSLFTIQGLPVAGEYPPVYQDPQQGFQTSLLYALPHEYRSPLTDIIGQASYLHGHAGDIEADEIREVSAEVLSAARRLLRTTDNFLMYAQIETLGDSPLHIQRMRQCTTREPAMIAYDAAIKRALAHQRNQDITLGLDIEGVSLAIMDQHLDKILGELIENALYFSRVGTPITLTATPTQNEVTFSIRDHGVGMHPSELEEIGAYRQFRRKSQEQQGIGLGLVIAKRLVELHGGTFTVSSALGLGTSISFTLPRVA